MSTTGIARGGKKTGGRIKGVANKNTQALRDMILGALSDVGGQKYLMQQAIDNPASFLTLIGKVLPTTLAVTGDINVVHLSDFVAQLPAPSEKVISSPHRH